VAWHALPETQRRRIDVEALPMVDADENALIVNALQRNANVLVKKSFEEGFGLGVTEAQWQVRPVVATRVGGQQDQVEHRTSGLLVDDAADLAAFRGAVSEVLDNPAHALAMAAAGHAHARAHFLADRHFLDWMDILVAVLESSLPPRGRGVPSARIEARSGRRPSLVAAEGS
jgi:trehalose synthase